MSKQVKININGKDYYCDDEILKLIMRNQDKIEVLEYNRDKAIEYIENNQLYEDLTEYDDEINFSYVDDLKATKELLSILRGEEQENSEYEKTI